VLCGEVHKPLMEALVSIKLGCRMTGCMYPNL